MLHLYPITKRMRYLKIEQTIAPRDIYTLNQYLAEISKIPLLSVQEEIQLTRLVKAGDLSALQLLVRTNLRFVVSVAKKYQHRGLSLGDLINEGNLGLIKAAGRFDETKGFKFISFAVWWIRQSIVLAIAQQTRVVRLPVHLINSISQINKVIGVLEQRLERRPTADEIAEEINMSEYRIVGHLNDAKHSISLNAVRDADIGSTLLDVIKDRHPPPDHLLDLEAKAHEIELILKLLSKREQHVLRLYYGLAGTESLSMDDIARLFKLTKARIRQIKDTGIRKIRSRMYLLQPNNPHTKQ